MSAHLPGKVTGKAGGPSRRRVRPGWLVAVLAALLLFVWLRHAAEAAAGPRYKGVSLVEWLRRAGADDPRERLAAERVLDRVGPEAVPFLVRALSAREPWYRAKWQWVRSRVLHRPPLPDRLPALRAAAVNALAALGPRASHAVPALVAAETRDLIGPTEARRALRAIGPAAAEQLRVVLTSGNERQRALVATTVADHMFRPAADRLLPALWARVEDPRRAPAREAIEAVIALNPPDPQLAARLLSLLPRAQERTACLILETVGGYGAAARDLAEQVAPQLAHPVPVVRVAAARALHALRPPAPEAVQTLIALLEQTEARWEAARALGEIGPDAAAAIPTLLALLETAPTHRPSRTPNFAALALRQLGPAAVPGLVALLGHHRSEVRVQAAIALSGHGAAAAPAVPGLIRMLRAEDPEEQMPAATTLGILGWVAAEALPELERLANLETTQDVSVGHVRSAARTALNEIRADLHRRGTAQHAVSPPHRL